MIDRIAERSPGRTISVRAWRGKRLTGRLRTAARSAAALLLMTLAAAGSQAEEASQTSGSGDSCATAAKEQAGASEADRQLRALYESEWAWRQKEFGREDDDETSTISADYLPKVDAATQKARLAYWRKTLAALDRIPLEELSPEERINAAVFRTSLESFLEDGRFRSWEMPFNSDSSFWTGLSPRQGYRTAEEYRRYLNRMRHIPRYFDEHIVNMRAGLRRGFSVPRATLAGRDASIAAYTHGDPRRNPFFAAFDDMPPSIPPEEQEQLRREAEELISEVVAPAYVKLLTFFREEYLPKARNTLSAEALPDGKAYYQAQIRKYTTLDLTAAEIHRIGLQEVTRIQEEMRETMRRAGFEGSFEDFVAFLRNDPQFYASTPDELMGYSAYVILRMHGKLKSVFGRLPRYRHGLMPVPDEIAPFYTAGRGGLEYCLMNTYDLPSRPLYQIPALTLHECTPGHSFQAALALEQPERPAFRRKTYFSGYGEGWGLYVEWLGSLIGIYRTPYEDFGRLSYEMWRAARLVIDTGIHHYGWTREQAIDYLASHTALSRREVETEVDRYISWPGQALAYKLGEMVIRTKRAEAQQKLGAAFDQRWFHDLILSLGSVPLPVLEEQIDQWIAGGGRNPYEPAACSPEAS